jgi:uncharacterized membrane protein (UPF0127 family)
MKVVHKESNYILGENIKHASTFTERLIGLMFVKEMKGMDGLILDPGNSIHNCFVRFPIDAIFMSKNNEIVKIIRGFKPWRFSWIYLKSRRVLELPNGKVPEYIKKGDVLEVTGV